MSAEDGTESARSPFGGFFIFRGIVICDSSPRCYIIAEVNFLIKLKRQTNSFKMHSAVSTVDVFRLGRHEFPLSGEKSIELGGDEALRFYNNINSYIDRNHKKIILYDFDNGFQRISDYCLDRQDQPYDARIPGKVYLRECEKSRSFHFSYMNIAEDGKIELALYHSCNDWILSFAGDGEFASAEEMARMRRKLKLVFFGLAK